MKIKKPLGNNAVLVEGENGIEQIAMGNGIGFKKREGDTVDPDKIQTVYVIQDNSVQTDVRKVIQSIQPDNLILASKMIKAGEEALGYKCNDSILLALADHLEFAITRARNKAFFCTPLEWDIKMIYPKEYAFSMKALEMIEEETHVHIPEGEASFIALHFINSQENESNRLTDMTETILYTGIVQNILDIAKYHYGFKLDQNSFDFSRFVIHVRYFVRRQLKAIPDKNGSVFADVIAERCPFDYMCAKKIEKFLHITYNWEIEPGELAYLTLHLNRVASGSNHL